MKLINLKLKIKRNFKRTYSISASSCTIWRELEKNFIPSRTFKQIRSHAQKFFKKMKMCEHKELGIDFTSKNIKNINDMIDHIKSINIDYNKIAYFMRRYK